MTNTIKGIMKFASVLGKITVDTYEITIDCFNDTSYSICTNGMGLFGAALNSVDKMDGVTTFTIGDTLIQVNAPYGDDI